MIATADAPPDHRADRELPPLTRMVTSVLVTGTLTMIALAFLLIQLTLEATGLIDVGQAATIAVGALVTVPVYAFASFIIACFSGALAAVFSRRFSFRRLYLLTAAAMSLTLLITAAGTSALMLRLAPPALIFASTTILNVVVAAGYGQAIRCLAGVSKMGAIVLFCVWTLYLIAVGAWGISHG